MGGIDLDPASCPAANAYIKATDIFTTETNGLDKEWHGNVYLNAPYGKGMSLWMDKVKAEFTAGHIKQAVLLLPARTNAGWFQRFSDFDISVCYPANGLNFIDGTTMRPETAAMFPSAIVYIGDRHPAFRTTFAQFGLLQVNPPVSEPEPEIERLRKLFQASGCLNNIEHSASGIPDRYTLTLILEDVTAAQLAENIKWMNEAMEATINTSEET